MDEAAKSGRHLFLYDFTLENYCFATSIFCNKRHVKLLKLSGFRPKTIDAYAEGSGVWAIILAASLTPWTFPQSYPEHLDIISSDQNTPDYQKALFLYLAGLVQQALQIVARSFTLALTI